MSAIRAARLVKIFNRLKIYKLVHVDVGNQATNDEEHERYRYSMLSDLQRGNIINAIIY